MTLLHRILGWAIVGLFVVIMMWALALRIARREETPTSLLATQHWTENLLILQTVTGIVLLFMGRRAVGMPLAWLHYLYGSIFPLIAVIAGRIAGLRRERYAYVGLAWGAFVAFALTMRGIQTACGERLSDLARCLGL